MDLRRNGHRASGFGLGDYAAFLKAQTDLSNQVIAAGAAGDAYYAADIAAFNLDYSDAVAAYQAAGQAGASSVATEIDAAGALAVTRPLTERAGIINVQLARLPKTGIPNPNVSMPAYYTRADADKAAALLVQQVRLYEQAIAQGALAAGGGATPPTPTPTPTPSSQPTQSGSKAAVIVSVVLIGAAATWSVARTLKGARHAHA